MTDAKPIAIIRQTSTVAVTFEGMPSEERRRALKAAGYRYDNGHWYRSQSDSQMASEEQVAQVLAA